MKKFDLYEIAIKILGLYLIVIIIENLRTLLNFIPMVVIQKSNGGALNQSPIVIMISAGLIVLILFVWFLLFRTKQVTRLISKPTDREEDIKLFAG